MPKILEQELSEAMQKIKGIFGPKAISEINYESLAMAVAEIMLDSYDRGYDQGYDDREKGGF